MAQKPKKIIYLEKILMGMATWLVKKYNPKIIGITGSLGKTSAKEAIFSVISGNFEVRKNEKNYNNEIGVPLTILGSAAGGRSVLKWMGVFFKWLAYFIFPLNYPQVLILEMGADRPGDIKHFIGNLALDMAVITDISGSHLEFFKSIEKVAQEKWELVAGLKKNGRAIINSDNAEILKLKNQSKRSDLEFITYGFSESAEVKAAEVFYNYSDEKNSRGILGLSFKLDYKGTTIPVRLNNILAEHSIYAALCAAAAGIGFGLNLVEITESLSDFSLPAGRMGLISGIKKSFIIDDTYNASPASTLAAIKVLSEISAKRKIAVLGDMLELGRESEAGHRRIAKAIAESGARYFFAVGRRMKFAATELHKSGFPPERIFEFDGPDEAKSELQKIIEPGDLILVKGSQGMRMEKIVLEVMAEPEKSDELLCRQDATWKNKPWERI